MRRRELARRTALGVGAGMISRGISFPADTADQPEVTAYAATFIVDTVKWPEQKSKAIVATVKRLEDVKTVRELTALQA